MLAVGVAAEVVLVPGSLISLSLQRTGVSISVLRFIRNGDNKSDLHIHTRGYAPKPRTPRNSCAGATEAFYIPMGMPWRPAPTCIPSQAGRGMGPTASGSSSWGRGWWRRRLGRPWCTQVTARWVRVWCSACSQGAQARTALGIVLLEGAGMCLIACWAHCLAYKCCLPILRSGNCPWGAGVRCIGLNS